MQNYVIKVENVYIVLRGTKLKFQNWWFGFPLFKTTYLQNP